MNPIVFKYLGIGLFIFTILAGAYYKGYAHEHDKLVAFQAQVKQEQADQVSVIKQKEKENEDKTKFVAQSMDSYYKHLESDRLQHLSSSINSATETPASNKENGGTGTSSLGACYGTEFYFKALKTEIRLEEWLEWQKVQHIPVGD